MHSKGGFVIVDDFKLPGGIGGGGWDHFEANMKRVFPEGRFFDLDVSHPIFHSFFEIDSLDIVPQAYNAVSRSSAACSKTTTRANDCR